MATVGTGHKIRKAYQQMNILGYADVDVQAMSDHDEEVAGGFDARRVEVERVAELGRQAS